MKNILKPKIIYGTAWKKETTKDLVVQAILLGYSAIDTACQPKHYREDLVGEALYELENNHNIKRDQIFLQTKFTPIDGQDPLRIPYDKSKPLEDQVRQSLDKSLQNLKTDYIDSLVIHSPLRSIDNTMRVWRVFEEFVNSGKVKQIGISNIYSYDLLKEVYDNAVVKPKVIQNRFYMQSGYDVNIRAFCNKNGIMYQSFWTLTANPNVVESDLINGIIKRYKEEYGEKHTPQQVFFKFCMQIGITPLTGTTSKLHMKEDLDVVDMKGLSDDEIEGICKIMRL